LHAEGKEDVGGELDAGRSGEAGWVNSDDRDGNEVEFNGFADDGGRAAEETCPEAIADDGNGAGAGSGVVGWLDGAAENGLNAELLVEVSGDELAGDGVGVAVDGGCEALSEEIFEREEIFEYRFREVLLTQELVDGVGEGVSY
jgi:hypothetical protein